MGSGGYNITVRFYEELNDFLPKNSRKKDIEYFSTGRRSAKDLIESFGVPHVEVDMILVNGEPADFSYIIRDGDRISVYPVFETFSIQGISHLRERPLRVLKFVLDVHLGKLARRMRLLGFDTDYREGRDDAELAYISANENRVILTRDVQLLKRRIITKGMFIRNTDPSKQLAEVLDKFDLKSFCSPYSRCIECNGLIKKIDMDIDAGKLVDIVPEGVISWCREFYGCSSCGKIYWKGSHYEKLEKIIRDILPG